MSQPYLSLEAELHDAFWEAEDDGSEVRLMGRFLRDYPGCALEVGAGSGRLMLPLLRLGFEIEGLELSQDMLALAQTRARRLDLQPVMHVGDMTCWAPATRYSALLAPAFTLQLAADPVATLRHWHTLLKPHGGLYLTVFMPYAELLGDLPENEWYQDHEAILPDGRKGKLETRHQLDRAKQLLCREHLYSVNDTPAATYQSRQVIRWIEHQEMLQALAQAGFKLERYFLDFDPAHSPADPDSVDFDGIITYHASWLDENL